MTCILIFGRMLLIHVEWACQGNKFNMYIIWKRHYVTLREKMTCIKTWRVKHCICCEFGLKITPINSDVWNKGSSNQH